MKADGSSWRALDPERQGSRRMFLSEPAALLDRDGVIMSDTTQPWFQGLHVCRSV
jgi:hypothetical protein